MSQYVAKIDLGPIHPLRREHKEAQIRMILTDILQPTEFFDWVNELLKIKFNAGLGPTEELGAKSLLRFDVKNCKTCPIAQFLVTHPRLMYEIYGVRIILTHPFPEQNPGLKYPLPTWANQFIDTFDKLDEHGYSVTTIIQVWETILKLKDIPWQLRP